MAFMYENDSVVSLAEPQDVIDKDQRIFDANESLTEAVIQSGLTRATERIAAKLKATQWWRSVNPGVSTARLPDVNLDLILNRQEDFTDLCVYLALSEYILPGVADFADPDSAERQKMGYYELRATELFTELSTSVDWYDIDESGTIEDDEKSSSTYVVKRIR